MDINGVEVIMQLSSSTSPTQTFRDTITSLSVGDSILVTFDYAAPLEKEYVIDITANLICDPSLLTSNRNPFYECVDLDDISIIEMLRPVATAIDIPGENKDIEIALKNESDQQLFQSTFIFAQIENKDFEVIDDPIIEVIPFINLLSTDTFKFARQYTVPNEDVYYIRLFLNSRDIYPEHDTLLVRRETSVGINSVASNVFTLEQNIPNPTDDNTSIAYTIPESGEVIFNLHTPSGQLLYTKVIQSETGRNIIELNTGEFAAGIYLYSLEYKGQKFIKRMSVNR